MMKLSEAIILGSTQVKSHPGLVLGQDRYGILRGCAFGMAIVATGRQQWWFGRGVSSSLICDLWPWLHTIALLPCGCVPVQPLDARSVIMHLFDMHVAPRPRTQANYPNYTIPWTLDQLVHWVRERENELEAPTEAPEHELETVGAVR